VKVADIGIVRGDEEKECQGAVGKWKCKRRLQQWREMVK
jgi:hypothetical protein